MFACNDSIMSIPIDFSNFGQPHVTLHDEDNGLEGTHPDSTETAFVFGREAKPMAGRDIDTSASKRRHLRREWQNFLPLAMDIIRASTEQTSTPSSSDIQWDIDSPQELPRLSCTSEQGGDESPLFILIGDKRQRAPDSLPSTALDASTTTSTRARKRRCTDRHDSVPSRNRQATPDQVALLLAKLSLSRVRGEMLSDLSCPAVDCKYQQLNGRMPDFRRHLRTHLRKEAEIRCKGVTWQDFMRYPHLFPHISQYEQPYTVPGEREMWIGGCLTTFSRKDALKRHLRNTCCAALPHSHR